MGARQTLPVRDVLALPALSGAQVLGGHAGLDRVVRTVNVMEVPDILQWVRRDELLLTTAYPLRDRPEELAELVRQLDARGLAGILVKPARYIDRVPQTMVDEADRRSFPVVALQGDASFNDIINGVLTVLLHRQAARLSRAQEIHDHFNQIVLTGGGFARISQALSEALGRAVALVDADGHLQAAAGEITRDTLPDLDAVLEAATTVPADRPGERGRRLDGFLVQPIRAAGDLLGAIVTTAEPTELSDDGWEALQYAATVSALRQVEARAVAAEDRRFTTVYLEELVSGESTDWRARGERAAAFGWDLRAPQTALVVGDDGDASPAASNRQRLRRLADAMRAAAGGRAIVWERSSEVAALLVVDDPSTAATRRAVEAVAQGLRDRLPTRTFTLGFGRAVRDPTGLPGSFGEARRALAVGRWSGGHGEVHGFVDLGVERLLAASDEGELAQYRDQLLGPLIAHDAQHHGDLLPTLEQFLLTRNAAEAARRLYVHHNTLRNRLARIEDLLGPFLDDGERCLSLALAVRIHRYTTARLEA